MPMNEVHFSIDAIPPSVNHYVKHTRAGLHYKTREAKAFASQLAVRAGRLRGGRIEAKEVDIFLWLGPGQRLDVDNAPKVILDTLVQAQVIVSDASIKRLLVEKHRDKKPQTDVYIRWE